MKELSSTLLVAKETALVFELLDIQASNQWELFAHFFYLSI